MLKPEFERKVLLFLRRIPRGRVVTYKTIAERFGIHPRTVGLIMKRNKKPDVFPCFKVVRSDGKPGGYSGGVKKKILLLRKNGVAFKGRVDLKKYLWDQKG